MKIFNKIFILILSISLAACSTTKYTTIRKSHDFDNILAQSPVVAIVPAKAEIYSVAAFGKKTRMHEYEDLVENLIPEILAENLKNKGFRTLLLTPKELHINKLSQSIILLSENYITNIDPLYKPNLWEESKAYNIDVFLDPNLLNFRDRINADYLIFIDYYAAHNDFSANAMNFAMTVLTKKDSAPDPIILRVGIINLKNGQLVWSNWGNVNAAGTPWGLGSFNSKMEVERKRINHFIKSILSLISNPSNK